MTASYEKTMRENFRQAFRVPMEKPAADVAEYTTRKTLRILEGIAP